jgi:hypothetical protein
MESIYDNVLYAISIIPDHQSGVEGGLPQPAINKKRDRLLRGEERDVNQDLKGRLGEELTGGQLEGKMKRAGIL